MTTYESVRLKCPRCGKVFRERMMMSTTMSGGSRHLRSDGFTNHLFMESGCPVKVCDCGAYFLSHECIVRGSQPDFAGPWRRLGRLLRRGEADGWDLPEPSTLDGADLTGAVAKLPKASTSLDTTRLLRLFCYWSRNDARLLKDSLGPWHDGDGNAGALLAAVSGEETALPGFVGDLLRGQLLRDLGRFVEAREVYAKIELPERMREELTHLSSNGRSDVVWLD